MFGFRDNYRSYLILTVLGLRLYYFGISFDNKGVHWYPVMVVRLTHLFLIVWVYHPESQILDTSHHLHCRNPGPRSHQSGQSYQDSLKHITYSL